MPKSKVQSNHGNRRKTMTPKPDRQCREVGFVLECKGAKHVHVCGEFNDWSPTCLPMIGDPAVGLWEKRLILEPGRYQYKFVVDGKWVHDPGAGENVPNVHGSLNSVVEVLP
jgi:1,4-alpha-glucan branching enzyme